MADNRVWQNFIEELKQKNDLVSVAAKYCTLQHKGRYYWARCPFHGEKTPSLCINEYDGFYYCYGCHTGGDVITWVKNIESLSYMEAVQLLASWANIEVPQVNGKTDTEEIEKKKKHKERLLNLVRDAAIYYRNNLKLPEAKVAWDYIKKRQLQSEIVSKFGLGYSLGFNQLVEYLYSKGYTKEELLESGVCKAKDGRLYDAEATRLIFPIIDVYGQVIAFCGRTLESNPEFAKYLNTADTPLFNKRKTLYGINYLKKKRQSSEKIEYVILCEGQMDVVSLHKAGFDTAVASMGTALTVEQAKLIKRFSDIVYICYDGDKAGQSATLRGLDILQDNNLVVKVVSLPGGLDPDDMIKKYGAEGYQKCLDMALPLTEYKIAYLKKQNDMTTADGKTKFLNDALDLVAQMPDQIAQDVYLSLVAKHADMNKDFLRRELESKVVIWKEKKQKMLDEAREQEQAKKLSDKEKLQAFVDEYGAVGDDNLVAPEEEVQQKVFEKVDDKIDSAEKYLLCSMVNMRPYAFIKEDITSWFGNNYREIYEYYYQNRDSATENFALEVYDHFVRRYGSVIAEIINYYAKTDDEEFDAQCFRDCLLILRNKKLEERQKELTEKLSLEADTNKRKEILEEIGKIVQELKTKKVDI
ncbi:MAG: DNA primase [Clostridia bacterium]|nr:DNA primase [Clostridia bacterium]